MCPFCYEKSFYDQDALNKHYNTEHHYCDMCKKLGKKKIMQDKGKFINMPEYEVFRDWLELRKHQEKEHHICDKPSEACRVLCFESAA
jgi:hypothetical protein